MYWLLQFLLRRRNFASLLITIGVSLWMISGNHERQAGTARFLTMYVFFPVQITLDVTTRAHNIWAENRRLKERVAELNTRVALLEEAGAEQERLRDLLGFKEQVSYDLVPVRVVAREPSQVVRSLVINAGSIDGLQRYMPVVDSRGLIGRTIEVLPHLSLVQLLRDPINRTSVIVRRTRVVGIVECKGGGDLIMRYNAATTVDTGDTVITSGLGGVYPKGLHVGVVTRTARDANPLFALATVKPFADFDRIGEAFVMRMSPRWTAFRQELDSLKEKP